MRILASGLGIVLTAFSALQEPALLRATAPGPDEPRVSLRFEGFLPGTVEPDLAGTFQIEFVLYRSPQGGRPIWSERREVRVERGRMDVQLGTESPILVSVHEETFKFLGASVNGAREVYPRFAIVNVVFASPEEALLFTGRSASAAGVAAPSYRPSETVVSSTTESATTWRSALVHARAAGGDLPDYEDWYAALASLTGDARLERAGHYEWVLPWVYDPASHGPYQACFRGRFQGCDYMDLSPANLYAYRLALPQGRRAEK